jgi:signal transduction histidine kinase
MEIKDNGRGFNLDELRNHHGEGAGLKNIKKRISMISGRFSMETKPGKGTRIDIRLPIDSGEEVDFTYSERG